MYEELKLLDLNITKEKEELLKKFSSLFCEYNKKVNLMSKNDEKVLFEKHIFDSLAFNLFCKKYNFKENLPVKIMDIGTGGGFPSIPLSVYYDYFKITAVDSTKKKIDFVSYIAESLKLKNLIPLCVRAEDIEEKEEFDIAVSRAMAELREILEYAMPYVKTGGYFIAYKSVKAGEEIEKAQNALKILNAQIIDKIEYTLPLEEENKRVLVVIKKTAKTADIYPRKNGIIKKKPL